MVDLDDPKRKEQPGPDTSVYAFLVGALHCLLLRVQKKRERPRTLKSIFPHCRNGTFRQLHTQRSAPVAHVCRHDGLHRQVRIAHRLDDKVGLKRCWTGKLRPARFMP